MAEQDPWTVESNKKQHILKKYMNSDAHVIRVKAYDYAEKYIKTRTISKWNNIN